MLQTSVAGIKLPKYAFNACGINNQVLKQLQKIADSDSSAVMFKSCSIESRKGNDAPKYIVKSNLIPGCTFNGMGLPNDGVKKNLEYIQELKTYTQKPLIMSTVGIENPMQENLELVKSFQEQGLIDLIEVNLSCPNIELCAAAKGQGVLGYDLESVEKIIKELSQIDGPAKVGLKLPPYTDIPQFVKVSEILLNSKIAFISSTNTLPGLVIDPVKQSTVIKPKQGQGGLGGDYIKPISLYNVRQFFERLKGKISIIGVGGIRSGNDAFEYLLAGADAVQIGTGFAQEGIGIFKKVHKELENILQEKGYSSIADAKGKLNFL